MKNKIFNYMKMYKGIIISLFFLYLLVEIITIVIPLYSAKLIDSLVNKDFSNSYNIIIIIIAITVFSNIANYIFSINKEKMINNFSYDIEKNAYNSLYNSNYLLLKREDKVLISQRILKDSVNISSFMFNNIFSSIINLVIIIVILVILYTKHFIFFVISFGTLPIYLMFIYYIRNNIHKVMFIARENRDVYSSSYLEKIKNIYGIKSFSILEKSLENIGSLYRKKLRAILKEYKIFYFFYSIEGMFTLFVQVIFFILGIKYIAAGSLTIGDFTIILTFYQMIIKNFNYYLMLGKEYEDYNISIKRLDEIENKIKDNYGEQEIASIENLKFENCKYDVSEDNCIEYSGFSVSKGEILKIEGKNGVGKTTLLNILLGLYPSKDTVFINDIDVSNLDMKTIRKDRVAYLNQNFEYIEGTALENINFYSDKNYDKNEILESLSEKELIFDSVELINILDKNINDLSEGQKQIIALIIIFLKDSSFIILDEPLKGLDIKNKEVIINYLNKIRENKIILLIEHDHFFDLECNKLFL